MLDFLKRILEYIPKDEVKRILPESHIWSADDRCVDFLVGGDAIMSVPHDEIPHSPLAQEYALHGTNVVDITRKLDSEKLFNSRLPEFCVHLDTGETYFVGPYLVPTPGKRNL